VLRGAELSSAIRADLLRLQDTTAQIRVRGAIVLLVGFGAIAAELGLEVILGTFMAGALLTLVDRDQVMTHPDFRRKLEAVGFGVFIPVFFVATGLRFDLDALVADASNLVMLPIFLAALVVVRGVPALVYRKAIGGQRTLAAGILQSTSLPFIVAATAIGRELGLVDGAESAALVGAGLLSVLLFPALGLAVLRRGDVTAPALAGLRGNEPWRNHV
jgi:Kef-type K+ transport system membrane component KefB